MLRRFFLVCAGLVGVRGSLNRVLGGKSVFYDPFFPYSQRPINVNRLFEGCKGTLNTNLIQHVGFYGSSGVCSVCFINLWMQGTP